jgi:hypothetical protein
VRKGIVVLGLALALVPVQPAHACGDKLLIVGRGSRFQRAYVALHPASLLVVNANVTGKAETQSRLKVAGHRLRVVAVPDLANALGSNRYDFVLADFRDVPAVARVIPKDSVEILPVLDSTSKSDMAAAAKDYKCLLEDERGMKGARHFLAALDEAMASKRTGELRCNLEKAGQ